MKAYFSIGGDIYDSDAVNFTPMSDEIFEEPRNVTAALHRRVGRFVKLHLTLASKWLLVSEVSFDSSPARGNYTVETMRDIQMDNEAEQPKSRAGAGAGLEKVGSAHMPVIVGTLATVIILLAAVIFFIVSRSKRRKLAADCPHPTEKMALNCTESLQFSYDPLSTGPGSDSGNSAGSRTANTKALQLDSNFNNSQAGFGSPRSVRASRQGSLAASPAVKRTVTPQSTPRLTGTPRRRVFTNPLSEPPLYMEPYQVMQQVRLAPPDTAILSDTSCGDYAVPLAVTSARPPAPPTRAFSDSDSSLDQNSDYVFLQVCKTFQRKSKLCRKLSMRKLQMVLFGSRPWSLFVKSCKTTI